MTLQARRAIAGEDLTRRRREYSVRVDAWMLREQDRAKVAEMEGMIEYARGLLNGSVSVNGSVLAANMSDLNASAMTVQRIHRGKLARQETAARRVQPKPDSAVFLTETRTDAPSARRAPPARSASPPANPGTAKTSPAKPGGCAQDVRPHFRLLPRVEDMAKVPPPRQTVMPPQWRESLAAWRPHDSPGGSGQRVLSQGESLPGGEAEPPWVPSHRLHGRRSHHCLLPLQLDSKQRARLRNMSMGGGAFSAQVEISRGNSVSPLKSMQKLPGV